MNFRLEDVKRTLSAQHAMFSGLLNSIQHKMRMVKNISSFDHIPERFSDIKFGTLFNVNNGPTLYFAYRYSKLGNNHNLYAYKVEQTDHGDILLNAPFDNLTFFQLQDIKEQSDLFKFVINDEYHDLVSLFMNYELYMVDRGILIPPIFITPA
jgi:hypothetical protein